MKLWQVTSESLRLTCWGKRTWKLQLITQHAQYENLPAIAHNGQLVRVASVPPHGLQSCLLTPHRTSHYPDQYITSHHGDLHSLTHNAQQLNLNVVTYDVTHGHSPLNQSGLGGQWKHGQGST